MKITTAILAFLLLTGSVSGQNYLMTDVDQDGRSDTVFVDLEKSRIVCKLSSLNYRPISSKPIEILNESCGVSETGNGFEFFNNWMRAGYRAQFRYNPKTKKVQLIGMSRYEFGNAANDGSGESSVNLLPGNYIGNWNYYDLEKESLIKMPSIKTEMTFKTMNLEDFSDERYFKYAEKCAELYHQYKLLNMDEK